MKNSLMKLASQFESKLGLKPVKSEISKTSEVQLPKNLKKLAEAEQKLQTKIAEQRDKFYKTASGPSVSYSGGSLPAVYHVCHECQGMGKVAINSNVSVTKFASTEAYLEHLQIKHCGTCDGLRVVKAVDDSRCTEGQLMSYAAEKADKDEAKKNKKEEKVAKKLKKLQNKAESKKLALTDPEKAAELKAKEKKIKSDQKKVKKAKKAVKKLDKFEKKTAGKFPFFAKKDEK